MEQEALYQLENPYDAERDSKWESEVLEEINKSDKFIEYLTNTMNLDIKRYFTAQNDKERDIIKGHFTFANYLKAKILGTKKTDKVEKKK